MRTLSKFDDWKETIKYVQSLIISYPEFWSNYFLLQISSYLIFLVGVQGGCFNLLGWRQGETILAVLWEKQHNICWLSWAKLREVSVCLIWYKVCFLTTNWTNILFKKIQAEIWLIWFWFYQIWSFWFWSLWFSQFDYDQFGLITISI